MNLKTKWWEYHKANPHIYELFVRFTMDVINAGHDQYSAKAVFERIRWHTQVDTRSDDGFKMSNNHTAYYARLFMHDYPEHDGFFCTKTLRAA